MKQKLLILVLIVIVGNVAYWALNKKFLHDDIIAMVTGKRSSSSFVLEQAPQSAAANAAQALVNNTGVETANEAPVEPAIVETPAGSEAELIQNMINELQVEIGELQSQNSEIGNVINTLSEQSKQVDQQIQEIGNNYQLSAEQLEQVLIENSASEVAEPVYTE